MNFKLIILLLLNSALNTVVAQNKFSCLIFEPNQECGFEELTSIDTSCIDLTSTTPFSSKEIKFYNQFNLTIDQAQHSELKSLDIEFIDWNNDGNRLIYTSSDERIILKRYFKIIDLMTQNFGLENRTEMSYSIPDPTSKDCHPSKCNQEIGLGQSWSFNGGYKTISVYLTAEFEHLTLFVDNLKN